MDAQLFSKAKARAPWDGYRFLLSAPRLQDIMAIERPQILEVGSPFLVPMVSRWAMRGRPIPTVGFYHSDLLRTYIEPYAGRFEPTTREMLPARTRRFIAGVYRRFDLTIAASTSVARELEGMGIPRVRSVPLGVDLEAFNPTRRRPELRKQLRVPKGKPLALFAGRLHLDKGLGVLTEAHARMDPDTRPHLLFVGKGPLEKNLRALSDSNSDISVRPFQSDRISLARVFSSADLYVAAGPAETFGLSVAEAMACGTPVVGVESGAVPDRLAGSGAGELYSRDDPDSCGAALERMMARLSPGIRAKARKHAEREFSWFTTFGTLLGFYAELTENGTGP